ncbi:hypothetical protein QBZ16_002172 [Prototheca wickerhamii]|uniref:Homologous-pairing protein 2 homolog n=1 Tax=Prototheca wickerhamii TaxID=3111 RepID=A0AAD9INK9_PROWI|nr:hypothetical protein QBZ16_002172 [Prototheca wickerhamii]
MAEAKCLALLRDSNKPYNVQGASDMLASQGFKKTQVDKALASLADSGKIKCKEFGKTKIYFALQEGLPELDPKQKEQMLAEITQLQAQCKEHEAKVATQRKELALLKSALTVQELQDRIAERQRESEEVRAKLARARESEEAEVSAEDLEAAEKAFSKGVQTWERLRKMFRNIWDTVRENVDANQADLFEEMGVDTDEAVGEPLSNYQGEE